MSRETDGWVARRAIVARRLHDHPDESPGCTAAWLIPPGNHGSERHIADDRIPADAGLLRTATGAETSTTRS